MGRLRAEEEWARRIVQAHLGCVVAPHDDGTIRGMYDLRVGTVDSPEFALEVCGAVDELRTKTWNTGPARGPWTLDVPGNWMITLASGANIRRLRGELPALLDAFRRARVTTYATFEMIEWSHPQLHVRANDLGVEEADEYDANGSGVVHFTMVGAGGAVDSEGRAVPAWIGGFLRDERRSDVLRKLASSGAGDARRSCRSPWTARRGASCHT